MKLASRIDVLQSTLNRIRDIASSDTIAYVEQVLHRGNRVLEQEVIEMKNKLRIAELNFGILQHMTPTVLDLKSLSQSDIPHLFATIPKVAPISKTYEPSAPDVGLHHEREIEPVGPGVSKPDKLKPLGKNKVFGKSLGQTSVQELSIDVGRLDMRVGRIVEVSRHTDADSLYVEKVDLGEGRLRTVVSGLVKFIPIDALENRVGIFMCNLKPVKMRGVESEAMLMCASAPEAGGVEPLILETTDVPLGEPVVVLGFNHDPDEQLNPKKKIFEQIKPDLRVDGDGFATYKGIRWTLKNHPSVFIKANALRDVQIA